MVHQITNAIPGAHSVSLSGSRQYGYHYDSQLKVTGPARIVGLRRVVWAPLELARLMVLARGFIYVGSTGFLLDQFDQRRFEMAFLKKHGLKIVCYWTGSDIRSTRKMNELEKRTGLANISTYIALVNPVFGTDRHEDTLRRIAAVADEYADAMFNNGTDHLSYLTRPTEPFLYFIPDEEFATDSTKFESLSPSSSSMPRPRRSSRERSSSALRSVACERMATSSNTGNSSASRTTRSGRSSPAPTSR
ncbi:hypothetical protein [Leifsonia poae]|uniref:hypothetical protein n=1 Tax=Leifsonia poae TaxID=110933 RepID=UPI003D67F4F4